MNKKSYDLYGLDCDSLDEAKDIVENLLKIEMISHDSSYHCGEYYRLNDVGQEHFILQRNYDEFEKEWAEENHSQYSFVLYINETSQHKKISEILLNDKRLNLLRHEDL